MHEINASNFNEKYSIIEKSLKNATLIALDSEFTGIQNENVSDLSLFDLMPQRYRKLRDNIDSFIAIQIGLTTLKYSRDENKYHAETFSFHLLPKQLPFADGQFSIQVSALEFLTRHNFDFNKWCYSGIHFLDELGELKLRKSLKVNNYTNNFTIFNNYDDEDTFTIGIDKVYKWLKDSNSNKQSESQSIEIECDSFIQKCYLQRELRNSFKNIWTESKEKSVLVIKVTAETRQALEEQAIDDETLENQIINYYLGFTRIFKLLSTLKKPMIGHNLLLDLMFIYKQFYKPLPKSYEAFKMEINRIFPSVYDTKFLSYRLKKTIQTEIFKTNVLQELFEYFTRGAGLTLLLSSPVIEVVGGININEEKYHDAGWDSYCTAYCFVKIAYVHASYKRNSPNGIIELANTELLYGIKDYKNCINVIKADLTYIKLDGSDPESTRPPWINICTDKLNLMNVREISETLASFGSIAIQPQSKRSILVATSNYRTAREILEHFQKNKDFRVALYNPLRQSLMTKSLIWGGIIVSGGLLTWLIHDTLLRPAI